jgi:glycerophosphoryl diester phosphodiesterase
MTLVVAHRGASARHAPGNTVEAFLAASELGADWVELDVHASADGALVVHHDPTLPDGRALHALRATDLPAWVPLLDVAIEACATMGVNVEIKGDGPRDLRAGLIADTVALLRAVGAPARFLVTSFDSEIIDEVRALAPELPTGLLTLTDPLDGELLGSIAAAGHVAINPWDIWVRPELIDAAHELGLAVNVWTVDDADRMVELMAMGVDAIITNHPDRCRGLLSAG